MSTLTDGTRLGPYLVQGPIGAGGMGEVYRAVDTRLDRLVAIKVLPAHLAGDSEFRERFEREAKVISQLDHPHICALYDVGQQDGVDFLVMQHLEGETLGDRLKRGALPVDQALKVAIGVASALDRAHRAGIVHRDLKPGNVMLTKDGAKLLDFGLAKGGGAGLRASASGTPAATGAAASPRPTAQNLGSSMTAPPTLTTPLTQQGAILGTFQYMAPEQIEGTEADARSDLFAFGAMLYEMVTGKRAFEGKSQASLLASILDREPAPMATLVPVTPAALQHVVDACLAKDPDARWQNAHDVAVALRWIAGHAGAEERTQPRTGVATSRYVRWLAAAAGIAIAAAIGAASALYLTPKGVPAANVRFEFGPPEGALLTGSLFAGNPMAVSPDGRQVAFVATSPNARRIIWVRALANPVPRQLTGTDGALLPFWSPDGRSIGFFAEGRLKRTDAASGSVQTITGGGGSTPRGGSWSPDGAVILYAPSTVGPLLRVPASGGVPAPATALADGDTAHRWPWFLPDSRRFLFDVANPAATKRGIYLGSLDSPQKTLLVAGASSATFVPPDRLVYVRDQSLMFQRFDVERGVLKGEPAMLVDRIDYSGTAARGSYSISEILLAYTASGVGGATGQLGWFDRAGRRVGILDGSDHSEISPDGTRVTTDLIDAPTGTRDVWVFDLTRGSRSRLTFSSGMDWVAAWSPDGTEIAYTSDKDSSPGVAQIYRKLSSGAGQEELLLKTPEHKHHLHWSPDGRFLVFEGNSPKTRTDLWILPLSGDRTPQIYLQGEFNEVHPQFSPDGRNIAYASDESGSFEVYVQTFPPTGGKWQVSTAGGVQPRWRRDGGELYYLAADARIMSVAIDRRSASFTPAVPQPLFQTAVSGTVGSAHFASTADGQRFLIAASSDQAGVTIKTIVNWAASLAR